jgi:hypothetical protein
MFAGYVKMRMRFARHKRHRAVRGSVRCNVFTEIKMDIYDVVKKIVGPINPVGKTEADDVRLESLELTIGLIDALLIDIRYVASYKDCEEFSRSRAGKRAENFLKDIREA